MSVVTSLEAGSLLVDDHQQLVDEQLLAAFVASSVPFVAYSDLPLAFELHESVALHSFDASSTCLDA